MGRVALSVLLLSLEIVSGASASNAGEARLASGVMTASQFGSGVANISTCLNANSTEGSCGGSPAGIAYATTARNWTQAISRTLTGGTQAKVTLNPCPTGIDTTSGAGYQVLVSGGGNSEAVNVVSGSCVSGAPSGTIGFTPHYSYPAGTTIGSASSGIQETLNAACGVDATSWKNSQCNVTIPANGPGYPTHSLNTYNVYGTIFLHSNQSVLSGYGVSLNCIERGPCLQVGDLVTSNHFVNNTISGVSFRTSGTFTGNSAYAGVNITNTVRTSNVATITTSSAHGFRAGDIVVAQFTDDSRFWGDQIIATVPTSTTYTYSSIGADIPTHATPGVVALGYEAVLDNGMNTHLIDINYDFVGEFSPFNQFFDFWDDENATIDHFNNNAKPLNGSVTWVGSWIYSAGNQNHAIAPVITLQNSTITSGGNGVTVYNSNGVYIKHTVIQGQGLWQAYTSNTNGNFQGVSIADIYSEPSLATNPVSSPLTPFNGAGIAGLIVGESSGPASAEIVGQNTAGLFPTGGTGATPLVYFIVANDTTASTQTSPMEMLVWSSTGSDAPVLRWPRVANAADTITYDIIRSSFVPNQAASPQSVYPSIGNCTGGSPAACGSIAGGTGVAQCAGLVCTFTDNTPAANTNPYTINVGNYAGNLDFWPGSIVSVNNTVHTSTDANNLVGIGLNGKPLAIATQCSNFGATGPSGSYTFCLSTPGTAAPGMGTGQVGTVIMDHGGQAPGFVKGKLNFSSPGIGTSYHHIITLIDSNPTLTQGTYGFRPLASVNDVWIGTDSPLATTMTSGQLAFGSPTKISNYIGNTGDNTSWLERLTSKQKTFAVPVRISEGNSFTLGDGSPLSLMKIYHVSNLPVSVVPPQSCVDVVEAAKGLAKSDQITSITPPGRLGNLSLNAYPSGEGAIILHFCNPSSTEAIAPPGAYSFLAVR
jgi:hypothetical protein